MSAWASRELSGSTVVCSDLGGWRGLLNVCTGLQGFLGVCNDRQRSTGVCWDLLGTAEV